MNLVAYNDSGRMVQSFETRESALEWLSRQLAAFRGGFTVKQGQTLIARIAHGKLSTY